MAARPVDLRRLSICLSSRAAGRDQRAVPLVSRCRQMLQWCGRPAAAAVAAAALRPAHTGRKWRAPLAYSARAALVAYWNVAGTRSA